MRSETSKQLKERIRVQHAIWLRAINQGKRYDAQMIEQKIRDLQIKLNRLEAEGK